MFSLAFFLVFFFFFFCFALLCFVLLCCFCCYPKSLFRFSCRLFVRLGSLFGEEVGPWYTTKLPCAPQSTEAFADEYNVGPDGDGYAVLIKAYCKENLVRPFPPSFRLSVWLVGFFFGLFFSASRWRCQLSFVI